MAYISIQIARERKGKRDNTAHIVQIVDMSATGTYCLVAAMALAMAVRALQRSGT